MAGPTGTARLRAFVSRNSGRDRRARRLLGIGQASILLVGLLLPTLIAGPVAANTRPTTATLTVTKACAPTNDPGRFNLRIDGTTVLANAACGSSKTVTVTAGRHGVSETSGSGTNLSNYTAAFGSTCPGGSITLTANQSATCTITNTRKPPPATATLTVAKACLPTTDPGRFNLLVDGKTALAGAACGSSAQVTVTTGRHAVSETSGSGTNLFNYAAAVGGGCDPTGSITLTANQSATCTITNTRKPTLTVVKACVPDPTAGQFDLLIDGIDRGDASCAAGGNRTTRPVMLGVGPHTIGETADGTTDLSAYIATYSANCAGATITLVAGQNAVCTITNTVRTPTLAVAKIDNGPWKVSQTSAQYTITVSNTGTAPTSGTITVADALPAGLTLGGAPTGTGWGCTGASGDTSFSCTSTTPIAAPGSGNPISVPVLFGPTTPIDVQLTNTASAYGGGDPAHASAATAVSGSDQTTVAADTADLQITKTDGVTEVVAGASTTYTIVVTNAGPADVTGAEIVDKSPFDGFAWTAVGTGGASGFTADNSVAPFPANIDDIVTMPAGSTITYTAKMDTSSAAVGDFTNTATVTAPSGITDMDLTNNSASDTDSLTNPIDLSISKTDGVTSVVPGQQVTYTIVVSNPSPWPAGIIVNDAVPSSVTNVTWTAVSTGCPCFPTSGTGSIVDEHGTILDGGSVTITLTGTLAADATGSLTNTATVTLQTGTPLIFDPDPSNNSATDTDTVYPPASLILNPGSLSFDWGSASGFGLKPGATLYICQGVAGCQPLGSQFDPDASGNLSIAGPIFPCGLESQYFPAYFETLTAAGVVIDPNQVTTPPC